MAGGDPISWDLEAPEPAGEPGVGPLVRTSKKAHTILVIDDDQSVRRTFATALQADGFNVRTAMSAQVGLCEATTSHPDAIIVDLRMPFVSGLGFLYRLRSTEALRSTPVAVVTGFVMDKSTESELDELGAVLRFKPLWLDELVELAHRLVACKA